MSEPDTGIYNAMNKGLRAARGRYVHFLNADDSYHDAQVLGEVASQLGRMREVDIIYGNIVVKQEDGNSVVFRPPPPEEAHDLMVCGCLPHQGSFARRTLFDEKLGMFNEQLKTAADYQWMLRALTHPEVQLHYFDRTIANFFANGASSCLALSLPESFRVQNEDIAFQKAMGSARLISCYQQTVLTLRCHVQQLSEESTRRGAERDRLKSKLVKLMARKEQLQMEVAQYKKKTHRPSLSS